MSAVEDCSRLGDLSSGLSPGLSGDGVPKHFLRTRSFLVSSAILLGDGSSTVGKQY